MKCQSELWHVDHESHTSEMLLWCYWDRSEVTLISLDTQFSNNPIGIIGWNHRRLFNEAVFSVSWPVGDHSGTNLQILPPLLWNVLISAIQILRSATLELPQWIYIPAKLLLRSCAGINTVYPSAINFLGRLAEFLSWQIIWSSRVFQSKKVMFAKVRFSNFWNTYDISLSLPLLVFEQFIDQTQLSIISHACLKDGVKHSDGLSHTCIEDIANSVSVFQSPPEYVRVSWYHLIPPFSTSSLCYLKPLCPLM